MLKMSTYNIELIDTWQPIREQDSLLLWCNVLLPLRSGSSLFSRMSLASVPSSIRSSLVITPMVLRPEHTHSQCFFKRANYMTSTNTLDNKYKNTTQEKAPRAPTWISVSVLVKQCYTGPLQYGIPLRYITRQTYRVVPPTGPLPFLSALWRGGYLELCGFAW